MASLVLPPDSRSKSISNGTNNLFSQCVPSPLDVAVGDSFIPLADGKDIVKFIVLLSPFEFKDIIGCCISSIVCWLQILKSICLLFLLRPARRRHSSRKDFFTAIPNLLILLTSHVVVVFLDGGDTSLNFAACVNEIHMHLMKLH